MNKTQAINIFFALLLSFHYLPISIASDHADEHDISALALSSGKLADFYMFLTGDNLIMIATVAAQNDGTSVVWNEKVSYRFSIDYSSLVQCSQSSGQTQLPSVDSGCINTIEHPSEILEDVFIDIKLNTESAEIQTFGLRNEDTVRYTYGLFDDPFIRSVVTGKNIAALVIEVPLEDISVHGGSGHLLGWITSYHNDFNIQLDHIGHPYRSQSEPRLNTLHPSQHHRFLDQQPDVLVLDPMHLSTYPNGRSLQDDIVDILGKNPGCPNPSENDIPFLTVFPYLAQPHTLRSNTDE